MNSARCSLMSMPQSPKRQSKSIWRPKVGQKVTIRVDTNGKDYNGHVQSIAGASGAITSLLPPENATGNYVKVVQRIPVKITFDPGETKEHVLRHGMSVEPKVWIK